MSLRLRLLVALVPLFVVGLAIADVATYASLSSFLTSRVDEQLLSSHPVVAGALTHAGVSPGGSGSGGERGGGGSPDVAIPPGTFGEILTPAGAVVAGPRVFAYDSSSTGAPVLPSTLAAGLHGGNTLLTVDGTGGVSSYRVIVDTVNDGSGDLLVVAIPLDDVRSVLTRLLVIELAVSGGIVLLIAATTLLVVRRSLRPLVRMGDTAQSIAAEDLTARIEPADGRTEIGRLGLALNTMLGRLEHAFDQREASQRRLREFVSDASHELRTPLTSMRGYAELLRRRPDLTAEEVALSMRRIQEQTERMSVLVDDLLLLARLDQRPALVSAPVDLVDLAVEATDDIRVIDPDRAVSVRAPDQLVVAGDEQRLRQVVGNLLRNATVHTPAATPIELVLDAHNGDAVLEIIDHGPGIPAGQGDAIFDRFHRAAPGRSRDRGGSGLGLSIVAAIVRAHGGRIIVTATPGGGATFRVTIPLAGGADDEPAGAVEGDAVAAGPHANASPVTSAPALPPEEAWGTPGG